MSWKSTHELRCSSFQIRASDAVCALGPTAETSLKGRPTWATSANRFFRGTRPGGISPSPARCATAARPIVRPASRPSTPASRCVACCCRSMTSCVPCTASLGPTSSTTCSPHSRRAHPETSTTSHIFPAHQIWAGRLTTRRSSRDARCTPMRPTLPRRSPAGCARRSSPLIRSTFAAARRFTTRAFTRSSNATVCVPRRSWQTIRSRASSSHARIAATSFLSSSRAWTWRSSS